MLKASNEIFAILDHGEPFFCGKGIDEEWDFISEALLREEALTSDHAIEVLCALFPV
ncbi:hypothetical protein ELI_14720 [Erythrobacter litoralis HTCC2594]|uniref:Uncharacterized protein n=1 Tax=Erythrobacter litoralis (strain HTCC2594) TaxID=314225 RepID=Q2N5K5_ERYLH|nr:hypothetical protein ELI_14720 [Erythrobacter litoralis HTCC2594]